MINNYSRLSTTSESVPCKLLIVPQQRPHLELTLQAFAAACNYVWLYGKQHQISQQWKLHQACYEHIREKFELPANLTIRAIARIAPLLKLGNDKYYPFTPKLIAFDSRTFLLNKDDWAIGITLLNGREKFHLDVGNYQKKILTNKSISSAMLVKKYKSYYLDIHI